MRREILIWPDPRLQQVSLPVRNEEFGTLELSQLIQDMVETAKASSGAGLSAIQVGVAKRIMVLGFFSSDTSHWEPLINPQKPVLQGGTAIFNEGCLSVPGFTEKVRRYKQAVVRFQSLDGKWQKMTLGGAPTAQCLQHELQHLDGHIFLEMLPKARREQIEAELRAKNLSH